MQKLVTGMRTNQGFTLIEILIVLVIIGISLTFALMSFGDFGQGRQIILAAEQLANTLRLAQQQAQLETITLGLTINSESYQIKRFKEGKGWIIPTNNRLYALHYFPPNTVITLSVQPSKPGQPTILLHASSEMTPFTLHFGTTKEVLTTLEGRQNGDLYFKQGS